MRRGIVRQQAFTRLRVQKGGALRSKFRHLPVGSQAAGLSSSHESNAEMLSHPNLDINHATPNRLNI